MRKRALAAATAMLMLAAVVANLLMLSTTAQPIEQPAMDLSRDKNAEEMKWSPLEMGAAMQAHGA